jgi:hypothetical protein
MIDVGAGESIDGVTDWGGRVASGGWWRGLVGEKGRCAAGRKVRCGAVRWSSATRPRVLTHGQRLTPREQRTDTAKLVNTSAAKFFMSVA